MSTMSTAYDEYEVGADLLELDEDWVKDLARLVELKANKTQIEAEIRHINEQAAEAHLAGTFTEADGTIKVVKIRQDDAAPRVDLAGLQAADPMLASKIVTFAVDSTLLKDHIKRGFFTNTPAEAFLITGKKAPWVQITTLVEETSTDE